MHGISAEDLETELDFSVVGVEFVTWMESFLGDGDVECWSLTTAIPATSSFSVLRCGVGG